MQTRKIYYSIIEKFPPYRVDVAELFGHCLAQRGMTIEWYMQRNNPGPWGTDLFYDQKVNLPKLLANNNFPSKVTNKLLFWLFDIVGLSGCIFKKLDILQVRDKYIAALFGIVIARIKGIKFIYWCSYPYPEQDLEQGHLMKGLIKYFYLARGGAGKIALYKVIMPLSDHVFVQSEQMKKDINEYGVDANKMTSVPMGVSMTMLNWAQAQQFEVEPGLIVYIGTLSAVRRMHVIIEAFAEVHSRIPEARLMIVGDGDFPFERSALEVLAQQLNLLDAIKFTGFLPIEKAWLIAASAQVCISPFYPTLVLNSASPTKLVEYMALGKPVVCNDHPEQSAIIQESNAGLCVEWGAKPFADAIVWILEHPQEAALMGAKGAQWVAQHRTYDILSELVYKRYSNILEATS